jgi:hypothetical protein
MFNNSACVSVLERSPTSSSKTSACSPALSMLLLRFSAAPNGAPSIGKLF